VRTFRAFLEFCYIARRDAITEDDLSQLQDALVRFHEYRKIFITTGVRSHFLLPRQHSMVHYHSLIRQFGAPNGVCSSITESKHIRAVKEPWRRSNRNEALGQMLVTNQRLDQLTAARTDFANRGMLIGTCLSEVLQALGELSSERSFHFSLFLMHILQLLRKTQTPSRRHLWPFRMMVMQSWKMQDLMKTSTKKLLMILMSLLKSHYLPASVSCNYLCTMTFPNGLYRSAMDSQQCCAAAPATYIPNIS
jgi:hypothetical protein